MEPAATERPPEVSASPAGPGPLPSSTLLLYALPAVALGYLEILSSTYIMKYAVDVLLIAPLAMGLIRGGGALWDAVSDPVVGHLSDRTRSRLGRRRPWMLASIPLLLVAPLAVWSPPLALTGSALLVWMSVAVLVQETAFTAFTVPHSALGAELTPAHHDRTRVFGFRHAGLYVGFFFAIGAMQLLTAAEDRRAAAFWLVLAGGAAMTVLATLATRRLREPERHAGRGGVSLLHSLGDFRRNGRAVRLSLVFLLEHVGLGTLGVLGPFYMQYVMGDESLFPKLLAAHLVPVLIFVPVAIRLSRRLGKRRVWAASMAVAGLAFAAMGSVGDDDVPLMFALAALLGVAFSIGSTIGPSVQADIVDLDEYETGHRQEGIYFAAWSFVRKVAFAIPIMVSGFVLQLTGYDPNQAQSPEVISALRWMFSGFPALGYAVGLWLFLRIDFDEAAHARIRSELDLRARDRD